MSYTVTADEIRKLREKTCVGFTACRNALLKTLGFQDLAEKYLNHLGYAIYRPPGQLEKILEGIEKAAIDRAKN